MEKEFKGLSLSELHEASFVRFALGTSTGTTGATTTSTTTVTDKRILHSQRLAEGIVSQILEYSADDMARAGSYPLLCLIDFILVATLKQPVSNVVSVQTHGVQYLMALASSLSKPTQITRFNG